MSETSLCIIGSDKNKTDLKLLEEAKTMFNKVFFVPIEGIGIGFTKEFEISYRNTSLFNFDAILPRIPKKYYNYAYQLFSLFPNNIYTPVSPISYLIAGERFFLLTVLRKRNIPTINLQLARSQNAAMRQLENTQFPIIIRVPDKTTGVIAESQSEAKSVIGALESLKQTILIEDIVKDVVSVYVSNDNVLCSTKKDIKEKDMVFGSGKMKTAKIKRDVETLALDAIEALDSHLGRVDIALNGEPKVVNINLNPDLIEPSEVTGIDLTKKVLESIHESHKKFMDKPLLIKFFDDAKSVVKDVFKSKALL